MKRGLVILGLILCAAARADSLYPGLPLYAGQGLYPGATPTETLLVYEPFGSGVPWAKTGTNVDLAYTPGLGSQFCARIGGGVGTSNTSTNFTGQTETWVAFYLCVDALVTNSWTYHVNVLNASSGGVASLRLYNNTDNTVTVSVYAGSTSAKLTDRLTIGLTNKCWLHFKKGTGADSVADFEFAAVDGSRVGSGNKYAQVSNGNATTDAAKFCLLKDNAVQTYRLDTLKVSVVTYPTLP
jgi:hypothetical protein